MVKDKLVSVIVPVYNAERYLNDGLNSLKNQTYKNLEILLINDGSKDSSKLICENFAKADSRFKLFNKENGGVSTARNMGLDNAHGEYVTFVDADDWVEDYYIDALVKNLEETNSDIVISAIKKEKRTYKKIKQTKIKYILLTKENSIKEMLYSKKYTGQLTKLFKRSLIKDLRFDNSISYGEDLLFSYNAMKQVNQVSYIENQMYHYVLSENSIVRSAFNSKKLSLLKAYEEIYSDIKKNIPQLEASIRGGIVLISFELLWYVVSSKYKDKNIKIKLKKCIKDNIKYLRREKGFKAFYRWFLPLGYLILKPF